MRQVCLLMTSLHFCLILASWPSPRQLMCLRGTAAFAQPNTATSLCTYHCELSRLFRTSVLFWQCCWLRCVDVTVKLHVYSCVLSSSLESLGLHVSSDLSVCHSHYIYLIILHALLWRTCHVCSFLKMVVHSLFSGCRWDLSRSMQNDANSHELLTRKMFFFFHLGLLV